MRDFSAPDIVLKTPGLPRLTAAGPNDDPPLVGSVLNDEDLTWIPLTEAPLWNSSRTERPLTDHRSQDNAGGNPAFLVSPVRAVRL
jgi:hypothetical protein